MGGIATIEAADTLHGITQAIGRGAFKELADGGIGRRPKGSVGGGSQRLVQEQTGTLAWKDYDELAEVVAKAVQQRFCDGLKERFHRHQNSNVSCCEAGAVAGTR